MITANAHWLLIEKPPKGEYMSEGVISPANAVKDVGEEPTKKRFIVVFCLFIGIFIAYLDRVNVSVLAANDPFLIEMGIKGAPVQIGMMMSVFLAAYGVANVLLAPIGDYLGPRKSMMLCIGLWTASCSWAALPPHLRSSSSAALCWALAKACITRYRVFL